MYPYAMEIQPSINGNTVIEKRGKSMLFPNTSFWKIIEASGVSNANPTFLHTPDKYFCLSVVIGQALYHTDF